nr:Xaa-Pro peptidase family protein [Corynebacterium lactis]
MSDNLFPTDVYRQRLTRTAELLSARGIGAAVFGTGADLQYLIGSAVSSHERLTALVIAADGAVTFVLPAVERGDLPASAIGDLDADVVLWEDGQDAHDIVAKLVSGADTLAIGASLTADHLIALQDLTGAKTVLANTMLKELFMRKDAAEVDQLREAGAAIDRVHDRVPSMLRAGRTEREVADEVAAAIIEEGHVAVDFVIVGSAENGANPHHDFSDRVIEDGDVVVVDIGGTLPLGYHSDCTRTYVVGKPGEKEAAAWAALREAQEAAVAAVRPGVTAAEIDRVARDHLTDAGYGEYFIHRTGHGIGLSTHEEPFIMAGNHLPLEPGMAFSVEPGVYLPGEFGMRLEDIIIVTEDGGESVNHGPHELIEVAAK